MFVLEEEYAKSGKEIDQMLFGSKPDKLSTNTLREEKEPTDLLSKEEEKEEKPGGGIILRIKNRRSGSIFWSNR